MTLTTDLSEAEALDLDNTAIQDELSRYDYDVDRGPLTGHAFAANGMSMVRDLTDADDIDADSNTEADLRVASEKRIGPVTVFWPQEDRR